ncbi:MAG: GTP-binding protein [Deltaproteobacteria bacterium]|nr:GTP-binding protein [Deltaproteobacteria bacterium]
MGKSGHGIGRKVDVLLLAGFLGAGKTTLLKRILSWDTDLSGTVVIVNEFGEVGVDGSLLEGLGSDVVELTSGCICCTLSSDLEQTLVNVWERYAPRRVFIEATGVADPKAVSAVLRTPRLCDLMEIRKIITVLDADFWEAREVFGPLFYHQLEEAHLILLNKIDLLKEDQVPVYLNEIHEAIPHCRVVPTIQCRVDPETLMAYPEAEQAMMEPGGFFRTVSPAGDCCSEAHDHAHRCADRGHEHPVDASEAGYAAFSFVETRPLVESCFNRFIEDLPWELFRLKGTVRFEDRVAMLNFVGGKSEWTGWKGAPETRLAFVGWKVDREKTIGKLRSCVST